VAKFSRDIGELFGKTLEQVVIRDQLLKNYFETAVNRMLAQTFFTALDISDLPCIEIDFPEDLARAEKAILPRVAGGCTQ
jgi:choline kinase